VPNTPADRDGCACRLLPHFVRPSPFDSRVGIRGYDFRGQPARASRMLRPAGSLGGPRPPLSRGFDAAGYPAASPASFQVNRQLPVWNLPPLTRSAFEAHYHRSYFLTGGIRARGWCRFLLKRCSVTGSVQSRCKRGGREVAECRGTRIAPTARDQMRSVALRHRLALKRSTHVSCCPNRENKLNAGRLVWLSLCTAGVHLARIEGL
jgi:hypothetical protein